MGTIPNGDSGSPRLAETFVFFSFSFPCQRVRVFHYCYPVSTRESSRTTRSPTAFYTHTHTYARSPDAVCYMRSVAKRNARNKLIRTRTTCTTVLRHDGHVLRIVRDGDAAHRVKDPAAVRRLRVCRVFPFGKQTGFYAFSHICTRLTVRRSHK